MIDDGIPLVMRWDSFFQFFCKNIWISQNHFLSLYCNNYKPVETTNLNTTFVTMSKELIVEVGFSTDPMWEVSHFGLEFSDEDLKKIRKHQAYLQDNPDIFKVVMYFDGECFSDEDKTESDFRADGGELFIFKDTVYYFTQSRYDASLQYESQEITNEMLWGDDVPFIENAVTRARNFLAEKGYFTQNLWTTDDVIETGKNIGVDITEDQAKEIFDLLGRRHDAEIGVNWDMIEAVINEYFNR